MTGELPAIFCGQLQRPGEALAGAGQVVRQPERRAPPRRRAPGRSASCRPSGARRSAAAPAPSRRRRRTARAGPRAGRRTSLGSATRMCVADGQLQAAADHRALEHGDDRHAARARSARTPGATSASARGRSNASRSVSSRQVEARREKWSPSASSTTALTPVGRRGEERLDAEHGGVVERVALLRRGSSRSTATSSPCRSTCSDGGSRGDRWCGAWRSSAALVMMSLRPRGAALSECGCSSAARCRSSTRRILPVALRGSSATNSR